MSTTVVTTMDGAIITASRVEPAVPFNPSSDLIAILGPTVRYAGYVQAVIQSLSIFLVLQAYALASITFATALYASRFIAFQAYLATKFGAFHAYLASAKAASEVYRSKTLKMLRRKLFFEFAVFVLGGSGNAMILMIFWPGWLVIGGASYAVWQCLG
ncbi:hypothetical protein HJFPF1_05509 [Paramyrothecium foliicola]|nr:hypothetical protein HJFPF1_05509 [Paramyrothecium foliicola]